MSGAEQVAVEIISSSDSGEADWHEKLEKYRRLGVAELVRFDPESNQPLRIWDLIEHDLLERVVAGQPAPSRYLHGFWLAVRVGLNATLPAIFGS